eukprot:jgi/Tetstr1/435822/TSEL_024710.t1
MPLQWLKGLWAASEPDAGPEYIGGRHWAFLAAEQALASQERQEAGTERAKRKEVIRQQYAESAAAEQARLEHEAAEASRMEDEARKSKMRAKKELQQQRARLRAMAPAPAQDDAIERLCSALGLTELSSLCDELASTHSDSTLAAAITQRAIAALAQAEEENKQKIAERLEAMSTDAPCAIGDPWSEEELRMLDKALTKFPMGTSRRWEQISDYLGTRTVDEVVKMVKGGMSRGVTLLQSKNQGLQIAKKRHTNLEIKDAATQRAEVLTDVQLTLKGEAAAWFAREEVTVKKENADWTQIQELALVKALKIFGKELGSERWLRVAEAVPGKSRAECMMKFKEMRDRFRNNSQPSSEATS